MANMEYCRFRNTLADFSDCVEAIEDVDDLSELSLSPEEYEAAKRLYDAAERYIGLFPISNL